MFIHDRVCCYTKMVVSEIIVKLLFIQNSNMLTMHDMYNTIHGHAFLLDLAKFHELHRKRLFCPCLGIHRNVAYPHDHASQKSNRYIKYRSDSSYHLVIFVLC